ncbi:MAG: CYTH and CHAD domain-containing protein [Aquabacterium sp.]|nr:MAG: CYTH and CHAD domain-containing protein [Aquabacterium sp.]
MADNGDRGEVGDFIGCPAQGRHPGAGFIKSAGAGCHHAQIPQESTTKARMQEVELKFQIPQAARKGVLAAMAPRGQAAPPRTRLQAIYFDTADRQLAAAGIALRLRKEGRRWVQTLKAGGPNALQRLEHNVEVTVAAGLRPGVDPARHAGTPAGELLSATLAAAGQPLQETFATDIWRRTRQVRTRLGTLEIALDDGWITAAGHKLAVHELEIELVTGQPRAVIAEARRWVQAHGLWLDLRTKAHRGDQLARGLTTPAAHAKLPGFAADLGLAAASRRLHAGLLDAVLMNASALAAGEGQPEHVHQLRVGLRRLRATWSLLEGCPALPDAATQDIVVALFRRLGEARDSDVLGTLLPVLKAHGGPELSGETGHAAGGPDLAALLAAPEATQLWLSLLDAALDDPGDATLPSLLETAVPRLRDWHRKARRDARRFAELDIEERHTLRKRLKRLRYGIDSLGGLLPRKAVRAHLKALRPAQEALGDLNDSAVAQERFAELVTHEPRAWFALGWLAARREEAVARTTALLGAWADAPKFWKE